MDGAALKEDLHDASRTIHDLASGIGRVQEQMEHRVRRGYDRTRGALGALNEQVGGFARESPLVAIAGAFAVGYLVAKLSRALT
jgi:hypothetical protein